MIQDSGNRTKFESGTVRDVQDSNAMKIELMRTPSNEDWMRCKKLCLNTIWKSSDKMPTDEWKHKILMARHSPIRTLWFTIKMEIPYFVSVHFVRHKIGVEHYVSSQRNDRQTMYDRTKAPQDATVYHIMELNAEALISMAEKRLCNQAAKETREVMKEIIRKVEMVCPEFVGLLKPKCQKYGKCDEFYPCTYK